MSLLLLILGVGAVLGLSLREFPDVEPSGGEHRDPLSRRSSDVVETRITQIIENEISASKAWSV
jgi:multidrug efflux pump